MGRQTVTIYVKSAGHCKNCRQSNAAYKAALEEKLRNKTAGAEQQKVTENRKRKALISSLEQPK